MSGRTGDLGQAKRPSLPLASLSDREDRAVVPVGIGREPVVERHEIGRDRRKSADLPGFRIQPALNTGEFGESPRLRGTSCIGTAARAPISGGPGNCSSAGCSEPCCRLRDWLRVSGVAAKASSSSFSAGDSRPASTGGSFGDDPPSLCLRRANAWSSDRLRVRRPPVGLRPDAPPSQPSDIRDCPVAARSVARLGRPLLGRPVRPRWRGPALGRLILGTAGIVGPWRALRWRRRCRPRPARRPRAAASSSMHGDGRLSKSLASPTSLNSFSAQAAPMGQPAPTARRPVEGVIDQRDIGRHGRGCAAVADLEPAALDARVLQAVDDVRRLPSPSPSGPAALERRQLVLQRAVEPRGLRRVAVGRSVGPRRRVDAGRPQGLVGHPGDDLETGRLRAAVVGAHRRLQLRQRREVLVRQPVHEPDQVGVDAQRCRSVGVVAGQAPADRVPGLADRSPAAALRCCRRPGARSRPPLPVGEPAQERHRRRRDRPPAARATRRQCRRAGRHRPCSRRPSPPRGPARCRFRSPSGSPAGAPDCRRTPARSIRSARGGGPRSRPAAGGCPAMPS